MKVQLWEKGRPDVEPIEREAVDAREILRNPNSIYTMNPPGSHESDAPAPKYLIEGVSPRGLAHLEESGFEKTGDLAVLTWDQVAVKTDPAKMSEGDIAALRTWHTGAHARAQRIAQEMAPQPGQPRKAQHPEATPRKA